MKRNTFFLFLCMLCCCTFVSAQQEQQKSSLHQRADAVNPNEDIAKARSLYIHAFNDYANRNIVPLGVECAMKATALYYKENYYPEAFDLIKRAETVIDAWQGKSESEKAALRYLTTKERMQMYIKMRRADNANEQLRTMESLANQSVDEGVKNDLLYSKAIYYYTFGLNAQGNAVFKEMTTKLTAQKEYDKVDEVFQTLIANGRKSGSTNMVAQSYSSYIAWKDSVTALKYADEINGLKQQIADNEATIDEKDSALTTRQAIIVGLCVLAAALAAALVIGALVLMRYILLTRKQKKNIKLLNDSNALKAKFISNISAQLEPTLKKIDSKIPEVKALLDFSNHIQTLSELENSIDTPPVEMEDTLIPPFCNQLADEIREKLKPNVTLTVNAPNSQVKINKEYVSHILRHLLNNAAEFTPEGGTISLEFKKRGPHSFQFLVSDTGEGLSEEDRENIFKPFREVRDLTKGDGLGLPICKQMALKMKGDLDIDSKFTKGTRFTLDLHA